MKIMKDGTIEPCCKFTEGWLSRFHTDGNIIFFVDFYGDDLFDYSPVNFCPSCGAKTEVEK